MWGMEQLQGKIKLSFAPIDQYISQFYWALYSHMLISHKDPGGEFWDFGGGGPLEKKKKKKSPHKGQKFSCRVIS